MRIRNLAAITAALLVSYTASLLAQASGDRARLLFTVSGGYLGGKGLWSIPNQPVVNVNGAVFTDTFDLNRSITPAFGAGLSGTYYHGEHIGLTGDAFLLGLGYEDNCSLVGGVRSVQNRDVCASIDENEQRSAAVTISGGAVFRMFSREMISPFARVTAGLLFSNRSTVRTEGFRSDGFLVRVYEDSKSTRVSPSLAIGVGATTPIGRAYHLRWEVRDNIVGIERVTAATPAQDFEPPHERTYKHLFSILIGIDVVLERSRGRRY